ncbi:MAG: Formate hydrogenlyase subunit 5 precursor [Lentisphaerae bacterium ADurb.BinA184]|nr:MAG: Formate hydrogenlyase subunit 5 precursor [Lentisphaerae bacterium ADurb.BinA184]
MGGTTTVPLRNPGVVPLAALPLLPVEAFRRAVIEAVGAGGRLVVLFGTPARDGRVRLIAILGGDRDGTLTALSAEVTDSYPALTPECAQAHRFEREIAEQWGVRPEGHPWLKPVRFHPPYRGVDVWGRDPSAAIPPAVTGHFRLDGEDVHEVAVGPVHAGIIEPGHFRFQCLGETVHHLEITLGYQHRGVERALVEGPAARRMPMIETLAGDTTVGHALAHCELVEALNGVEAPLRAQAIRGISLELERLANHTGDLGALANDVAFLPTAAYCGRLRGDLLNLTALLCGNRFGRGLLCPGGVMFDLDADRVAELDRRLEKTAAEVANAVELLWTTSSVLARFEETGVVSAATARELGLVGVAARACGLERDVRFDYASGIYRFAQVPVSSWPSGDVFARAYVRWLEVQRSVAFVRGQLATLPAGEVRAGGGEAAGAAPGRLALALCEGWRGEVCHVAVTDGDGQIVRYKVVDPSFQNWPGLAMAMRGEQISNFPLCNKSFNLSYCGHDL